MENKRKRNMITIYLNWIEKVGNMLPHPVIMFAMFTGIMLVLSAILAQFNIGVYHPVTGNRVEVFNLLSGEGIVRVFSSLISNFTGFAPLGVVLTMCMAVGLMERLGLIENVLKSLVIAVPPKYISAIVVFAGVISSAASDIGFVVLVPLGALIFASVGRHPLAGLAAAFAGVAGGFGANILFTTSDALLGSLSTQAVYTIDPTYNFNIIGNWFFMIASTFLITIVGAIITEKIIEPRLGEYKSTSEDTEKAKEEASKMAAITTLEKKGMKWAGISMILTTVALMILVVPEWGPMRGTGSNPIIQSPFFSNIVPLLFFWFLIPGLVYGFVTKQLTNGSDISEHFIATMESLSSFIVIAFFAGQFIGFFNASNIGIIVAVNGGYFLQNAGFVGFWMLVSFAAISAFVNLFIGSASAQWAIFAPIFIPMLMQLGYTPEFIQLVYRIGDSVTNPISPLFTYFALILTFTQRYDKDARAGTVLSLMIPYSFGFAVFWLILLWIWMQFNLPIGPGSVIML